MAGASKVFLVVASALTRPVVAPLPRGAHPHEVARVDRDARIETLGVVHDADEGASYPYSDFITESLEYCYRRLVKDPDCCVDELYAPGTQRHVIDRPGTSWECGDGCYDTPRGRRGRDVMWVPDGATCNSPRILWVHGGSWWYGSPDTLGYAQMGSKLAALTGAVVLIADYPLIPVGNYSVILRSVSGALRWLAERGPEGCGPSDEAPLFIGGDSAGGGTALSLVLTLKRQPELLPGRTLAGALLWSPWTNLMCNTPEYYHHAFAAIVHPRNPTNRTVYVGDIIFQGRPEQNLNWFTANAKGYVGSDHSLLSDPFASPFHAGEEHFGGGGVPPLYFAVGSSESIEGDSVVVAQKASSYGVDVHLDVYTGMWHVFPMYSEGCGSGMELGQAKRAYEQTAAFVRWASARPRTELMVPSGFAAALRAEAIPGISVAKPPYTILNYELEKVSTPTALAAQAPASGALRQKAASAPSLRLVATPLSFWRLLEDHSHLAMFSLGAGGVLAIQAVARSFPRRPKERVDSLVAPLIA